jgi:hypothetical protein
MRSVYEHVHVFKSLKVNVCVNSLRLPAQVSTVGPQASLSLNLFSGTWVSNRKSSMTGLAI